jgi:hypothetical protein
MPDDTLLRLAFLRLAGGTAAAGIAGCGGGSGATPAYAVAAATTAPATPTPSATPSGPSLAASIAISRASTSGTVPAALAGLSYEKATISSGLFSATDTTLIGCFTRLGPSILRIGGNSVDKTTWTPAGAGRTSGQVAPADIAGLAAFVQATGWRIIYGINLGANTPAAAAAEATVAAAAFGATLYGFEIGNECDLYKSNGFRPATYTVSDFITEWASYAAAIRGSVPNAPLTGPASAGSIGSWTVPFAAAEAAGIRLLTQHYYRANGQDPTSTISLLLAGDPNLPGELAQLQSASTSDNIANGYRIAEANSFYNGGAPNVSDAYGTALWAVDFLLINALNGSAGVNFHGGGSGPGYTPIADSSGAVVEVRPEYYGMLLVAQIPPGPMYPVTITTMLELTAYAVSGANGSTSLVIVNTDPANIAVATIALGASASRAVPLVLAGAGLNATEGTTLGGASIANTGAWTPIAAPTIVFTGPSLTVNVAPATAVLYTIA